MHYLKYTKDGKKVERIATICQEQKRLRYLKKKTTSFKRSGVTSICIWATVAFSYPLAKF